LTSRNIVFPRVFAREPHYKTHAPDVKKACEQRFRR
jgi:hypothetical protein